MFSRVLFGLLEDRPNHGTILSPFEEKVVISVSYLLIHIAFKLTARGLLLFLFAIIIFECLIKI